MVPLLADEDLNNDIIRAARRVLPTLDIVRVQDLGLMGQSDAEVLEWAAHSGRAVVTHDVTTLVPKAIARIDAGLGMPGVVVVQHRTPLGVVADSLVALSYCSAPGELEYQIVYLPL